MRLSLKFTAAFVLVMCIVWAGASYTRVKREIALFESDMRRDHMAVGRDLGEAITTLWRLAGEDQVLAFIARTNETKSQMLIRWVWLDGGQDTAFSPGAPDPEIAAMTLDSEPVSVVSTVDDDSRLYTYVPIPADGNRWGALELSESLSDRNRYVQTTLYRAVGAALLIITFSGVVSIVLGILFVARPVKALIDKARKAASGDLTAKVYLRQSDELSVLAGELNAMTDRLAETHTKLTNEVWAHRATADQLRHANRLATVGWLMSSVAHELATPLNVVHIRAKSISSKAVGGEDAQESAEIIVKQAAHMTAVVKGILEFARRRSPERTETDIRDVVQQTLSLLLPVAAKRGIQFTVSAAEKPLMALVNSDQIQQVISNLVVNSIQAMQHGGIIAVLVRSETRTAEHDPPDETRHFVCVTVEDGGPGIPEEHIDRLFEAFYTTKPPEEGTGLGLSISAEIVREQGGWIDVANRPGGGARFSVFLPQRIPI
ncbi:MAG TPA: HAMP domain-containing sensor histidine kinase [Acidobacteriota bacterium]|nr:HAMP domain-containing sensor histidine kinase [Acidobacteriota bacterium]